MAGGYGENSGRWWRLQGGLLAALLVLMGATGCSEPPEGVPEEAPVPIVSEAPPPEVEEEPPQRIDDDRSVAQRLEDATTATRVRMRLVEDAELRRFDFETASASGRVVLRGEVQTPAQRERAAELARGVEGVRAVVNEITSVVAPAPPPAASSTAPAPSPATKPAAPAPAASGAAGASYHTVRSGESLWTIARQYDTSVERIQQLNSLRGGALKPGQRLRVR